MKQTINAMDYAGQICTALQRGVLLTTASEGKVNTMTIGWGAIGIEWNRPVFLAYVRESRFTKQFLDESKEFTVNIPVSDIDRNILRYCGTVSGRDVDKIQTLGLHLEEPVSVSVPGIRELPLTLECKVIYQRMQDPQRIPSEHITRFYTTPTDKNPQDIHCVYYGEIVNAYLITD